MVERREVVATAERSRTQSALMAERNDIAQMEERHYTVKELAKTWRLSAEFVRQLVEHEAGVTEWVRQQPGKRRYRVLRIPRSVAERVYRRAVQAAEKQSHRTRV